MVNASLSGVYHTRLTSESRAQDLQDIVLRDAFDYKKMIQDSGTVKHRDGRDHLPQPPLAERPQQAREGDRVIAERHVAPAAAAAADAGFSYLATEPHYDRLAA